MRGSPTIVHDELPRQLGYPVNRLLLQEQLFDLDWPEHVGIYFLYTSGKQVDHYDPLFASETRYPVLVLDNAVPPLNSDVLAHLAEQQGATDWAHVEELGLPGSSIVVLPVKARMRRRVARALAQQGIRAMKNWLACPRERQDKQRPLVLLFDEESDRIVAKFADEWRDPERPRIYA